MFNKLKMLINEYKKAFKYKTIYEKIFTIVMIILFMDMTYALSVNLKNEYIYKKDLEKFNSDKNVSNIQEEIKSLPVLSAINKVGKNNIKSVIILNDSKESIKPIYILTKDNILYKTSDQFAFSISTITEPKLMENNISTTWTSSIDKSKYTHLPELKLVDPIIFSYIEDNLLMVLFIFLITTSLISQGIFKFKNKFDILLPKNNKMSFDNLVGMDKFLKEDIMQLKDIIENKTKYEDYGIYSTFNILFSGPAGTGKTKTAQALAHELNVPMVLGTGNVETGFVGGGAQTISMMFKTAEQVAFASPKKTSILFLDEGHALLKKRGTQREKWADDAANEFLDLLDGIRTDKHVNVVVIVASNFDDTNMSMDEAMERRFKKKLFFRLPDKDERKEIISFYLSKIKNVAEINIDNLANISVGMSPAKIETLINEASLMAVRENKIIDTNLLLKAFEIIAIGHTNRDKSKEGERYRIAIHEIGHFIVQYDIELKKYNNIEDAISNMKLIKISSERISKYNVLGYVLNENDDNLKTIEDYEHEIMSLYGGFAAESHFFKSPSLGATNDFEKVTKILKNMYNNVGFLSSAFVNESILNKTINEEDIQKIKNHSVILFEKTQQIIDKYDPLILCLADKLLRNWVLYKEDILKEILKYYENKL